MTDVTITSITATYTSVVRRGIVAPGSSVVAGSLLYRNANGYLDVAGQSTLAASIVIGIALSNAVSRGVVSYVRRGQLTLNSLTTGTVYVLSPTTPGALAPSADLSSGSYVTLIGLSSSSTVLNLAILPTGIKKT